MRLVAAIDGGAGSLRGYMESRAAVAAGGLRAAAGMGAREGVARYRANVLAGGLGPRLANTVRGLVYPKGATETLSPAAFIFSRAPRIVAAFEQAPTIRPVKGSKFLWIPTENVPKQGRRRMSPGRVEEIYGDFEYVPSLVSRGTFLAVVPAVRSKSRTGFRQATVKRRESGRGVTRIYPANLLTDRDTAASDAIVTFQSAGYAPEGQRYFEIDPARVGTSGALSVRRLSAEKDLRHVIPLTIKVAQPVTGSPALPIHMIGDSITNRQQPSLVRDLLTALGYAPSFIGTVPSSGSATSSTDASGPLGECRESRAFSDYTYEDLDGEVVALPAGQEAAYMAMSKADKLTINPYVRPSTGSDPVENVFNGHIFDFAFYLARFGLPTPAVVWINHGTNDRSEESNLTTLMRQVDNGVRILAASIRAAAPNAVILFGMPAMPMGVNADLNFTAENRFILAKIIERTRAFGDARIRAVGAWAHMSADGYPFDVSAVNAATGVATTTISDGLHPAAPTGRAQLAAVTAAAIAAAFQEM
ncbi:DUF6441 family protein [Methylopila musalis]|uniref:DUF6441 family protein n=1 Tax=Methylopila musalis TaxID=1134781 RepID=A0ABW3Z3C7_9HYPH